MASISKLKTRWAVGIISLLVGVAIGVASGSTTELDAAKADLASSRSNAAKLKADVDQRTSDLVAAAGDVQAKSDEVEQLEARIKRLTLKGEVPDLVGEDRSKANDVAAEYEWNIKVTRQPSDKPVGEILAQSPPATTTLKRGRSLTLVIAEKRPKQWTTIKTFSGSGERRTDELTIPNGPKARLHYIFSGDSNASLWLKHPGGDEFDGDLLLNEIGDFDQTTRVYAPGRYYLEVCCGNWTVDVQVFK